MNSEPRYRFQRLDSAQARQARTTVEDVYRRSYIDAIASGDPFDSPEQFMHRFDNYTSAARDTGFSMIIAWVNGEPAGQTWGWVLEPNAAWWRNFQPDDATLNVGAFTHEDGTRTFALSEIMVCSEQTGRGLARALHDRLLSSRTERRATLLVEPDNLRAYRAYENWGWVRVGVTKPNWPNAPVLDVLLRELT
ncbi:GNAT family N-acetyltransferase [Nocardia sp. NPDC051321]|uniref:GNAT family N-acetyltransferase n=1 Tax=Nocardia sp. NPDC051321 TaxID=3364323 RepID=UPI0037A4305A